MLFLAAACWSGANSANSSEGEELHADIIIRPAPNQPVIEITLYRDISEAVNGKTNKGFVKNVVAVYDPMFNGIAMTNATNLSGQPIYKVDGDPGKSNKCHIGHGRRKNVRNEHHALTENDQKDDYGYHVSSKRWIVSVSKTVHKANSPVSLVMHRAKTGAPNRKVRI